MSEQTLDLRPVIGARLRAARTDRHMTVAALSRGCGLDRTYLHRLERGDGSVPSVAVIAMLAAELDVPAGWLAGFENDSDVMADPHTTFTLEQLEAREAAQLPVVEKRVALFKAIADVAQAALDYATLEGQRHDHTDRISS